MLEVDAPRHAIVRHDTGSLRKLRFIQSELELTDDTESWACGDQDFHELLYAPCGRIRTLNTIHALRAVVQRFYLGEMQHSDHKQGWKSEHRNILKAVELREADAACALLSTHLRETERVVRSVIQRGSRGT